MKISLFGYECTLRDDVHILNRQRAATNVGTTLTQFKTPTYWHIVYTNDKLNIFI